MTTPRSPVAHSPVALLTEATRHLARAAADFDADLIITIVQASIDDIGVVPTWEQLVHPVWQHLSTGDTEHAAAEPLFVQSAITAITAMSGARRPARLSRPSVLLACADEELQVFPLEALVAALEESGVPCCVLGARVPPHALAAATARLRPAVVAVWSQLQQTADPAQITTVLRVRPAPTIIAAGPGWADAALPPQAVRPTDLSTALALTLAALHGRHPVTRRAATGSRRG